MIDGLWLALEQRGQGPGRQLLVASEEIAVQRGRVGSWLGTFDFRAQAFYERQGYSVFAGLAGFPPGHTQKRLRFHLPRSDLALLRTAGQTLFA